MKKYFILMVFSLLLVTTTQAQLQVQIYGDSVFCAGTSAQIWADVNGGTPPYMYQWSQGSTTDSILSFATGAYSVTVTDFLGDTASASLMVTELPAPLVAISASQMNTCLGSCVTLTASGGLTYMWNPTAGLSCQTCAITTSCPVATTTYTVIGSGMNGCSASATVTITVGSILMVGINASSTVICPGDSATLTATGADVYTWSTLVTDTTIVVSPTTTTTYSVTGTDVLGCTATDDITISVVPCSNLMPRAGMVYQDLNQNGSRDAGEPPLSGIVILQTPSNYCFVTNDSGIYQAYYDMGTYSLQPFSNYPYCSSLPASHSLSGISDTLNDFGIFCTAYSELEVSLVSTGAHPGLNMLYYLLLNNNGNQVGNGSVNFVYDSALTYNLSTLTPDYQAGDSLSWNFSNLLPGESLQIGINFMVSSTLVPGTSLHSRAEILPLQDSMPSNNIYNHWLLVTGPYDPNDKQVSDTAIAPADVADEPYLYYTIRFQNSGNDTAMRIVLRDTLDALRLNIPSIVTVGSSHPCSFDIEPGNIAVWTFDPIMLPDSNADPLGSQGFVNFRIRIKDNLLLGDSVSNHAGIFFDFNSPVITNTVVTRIEDVLVGIAEAKSEVAGLKLFPNPVNDRLDVIIHGVTEGDFIMEVYELSGHLLISAAQPSSTGNIKASLDISKLNAGVYFLIVSARDFRQVQKFVVLR